MGWLHSIHWQLPSRQTYRHCRYPSHLDLHRCHRHHHHHHYHSWNHHHCLDLGNQPVRRSRCRYCRCTCHPLDLHRYHPNPALEMLASLSLRPSFERELSHSTKHHCPTHWVYSTNPRWMVQDRCTLVDWLTHHHQDRQQHHHCQGLMHPEGPNHTGTPSHPANRHYHCPNQSVVC